MIKKQSVRFLKPCIALSFIVGLLNLSTQLSGAAPARRMHAAHATPARGPARAHNSIPIAIASTNAMAQGQYEHDFTPYNAGGQPYQERMIPFENRRAYFYAAFKDPHFLGKKDFVMLQEFGLGISTKDLGFKRWEEDKRLSQENPRYRKKYEKFGEAFAECEHLLSKAQRDNTLSGYLKLLAQEGIYSLAKSQDDLNKKTGNSYESVNRQNQQPGIVDLFYDENKYKLLEPLFDTHQETITHGRYVGGIFQHKQKPELIIGAVSVHIPGSRLGEVSNVVEDIEQLNRTYRNKGLAIAGWIVAGDFNIDYNDPAKRRLLEPLESDGFKDAAIGCCDRQGNRLTALGKIDIQEVDPRGNPVFKKHPVSQQMYAVKKTHVHPEGIDYIWYQGNVKLASTGIYPSLQDQSAQLLTGGNIVGRNQERGDDSKRDFFSDHAIISAEFQVTPLVKREEKEEAEEEQALIPFRAPVPAGRGRGGVALAQQQAAERARQQEAEDRARRQREVEERARWESEAEMGEKAYARQQRVQSARAQREPEVPRTRPTRPQAAQQPAQKHQQLRSQLQIELESITLNMGQLSPIQFDTALRSLKKTWLQKNQKFPKNSPEDTIYRYFIQQIDDLLY